METKTTHELTNHVIVDLTHDNDHHACCKHEQADLETDLETEIELCIEQELEQEAENQ